MSFEEYLISKKIDLHAFEAAEAKLFTEWKFEFAQMHPNSFTLQKLNLINPIRRKYTLKAEPVIPKVEKAAVEAKEARPVVILAEQPLQSSPEATEAKPQPAKPARPVFKPKMK